MLFITGETKLTTLMKIKRLSNLHRIRHLPRDTQLRKLYEQGSWHNKGFIFNSYEEDERETHAELKLTSTSHEELTSETRQSSSTSSKKILKQVCVEAEQAERFHRLRLNHSELLEGAYFTPTQPLLDRSSLSISSYAKWLVGATKGKVRSTEIKDAD